jgi:hypothetical protein
MRLYVNDALFWTGIIDSDVIQYDRAAFPFEIKFVARDLRNSEGVDYPETNGRERIIKVLSTLLPFPLPIKTYTSWKEGALTATQDFLHELYIDRRGLREFRRTGDEADRTLSKYNLLGKLCANFGLIVRQEANAWKFYQLTALSNPASVREFSYDNEGEPTGNKAVDLRITDDRENVFIIPRTTYWGARAYKDVRVRFDHRTTVQGILLPDQILLEGVRADEVYSQFFAGDGTQRVSLSGPVQAETTNAAANVEARIKIRAGQYYWDDVNAEWSTNSLTDIVIEMTPRRVDTFHVGFYSIFTEPIPADATTPLELSFSVATDDPVLTRYSPNFEIINKSVQDGQSTAIDYRLTQELNVVDRYDHGSTWYGDGPTTYAVSAISRTTSALQPTSSWYRQGESTGQDMHRVLLREIMDTQRSSSDVIRGRVLGMHNVGRLLMDKGAGHFFLGGSLIGRDNMVDGDWLRINVVTADTDTFEIIFRTSGDAATGSAPASGGTSGGSAGGFTQVEGDARYARRSQNLADLSDPAAARANIDVYDKGQVDSYAANLKLEIMSLEFRKAAAGNQMTAGDGIVGGGILANNLTFTLGMPGTTQVGGANAVTTDSHTHALDLSGRKLTVTGGAGVTISNAEQDLGEDRSWTVIANVADPVYIENDNITLRFNDPLYLNGNALDVRNHGDGVRGVILATAQDIFGPKNFKADVITDASFRANAEVRINLGIIKAPVDLRLENATNTNLRKLSVAQATAVDHAVAAGRTLAVNPDTAGVITWSLSGAQDLTANRTWTPTVASHGDNQRGTLDPTAQDIFGTKTFKANVTIDSHLQSADFLDTAGLIRGIRYDQYPEADPLHADFNGLLRVERMRANELRVKSFIAEISAALYGEDILTKSRGVISRPFTVPAVNATATLFVEDLEGFKGVQNFEANDWIRMRVVRRTTGLEVFDVWGQVTNYIDEGDGEQSWTFTRRAGGSAQTGDIVNVGGIAIDYGEEGDGVILRTVLDPASPKDMTLTWDDNPTDPANYTIRTVSGNLAGLPFRGQPLPLRYGVWVQEDFYASFSGANSTGMAFGRNAGGDGKSGMYFDENNYWILGDGFKTTVTDGLQEAVLDIQSDIIELGLRTGGAYSGITFLSGKTVIKAEAEGPDGTVRLASITLDANPTPGSRIKLFADDIILAGGQTVTAYAGSVNASVSSLTLRADEAELFTRSAGRIGTLINQISSPVDSVELDPIVSIGIPINTRLLIGGVEFVVDATTTIVSGTQVTIPVVEKVFSGTLNGDVFAALNLAGISTRVTEQGSELVLKAQTDGTLALVALNANPSTGSSALIKSDKFDLLTSTFAVKSASTGSLVLGANATSQTLLNGTGLFANGAGSFRAGSTVNEVLSRGFVYNQATNRLTARTEFLDVSDTVDYSVLSFVGTSSDVLGGSASGIYTPAQVKEQSITMPEFGIAITGAFFTQSEATLPTYPTTQSILYQYIFEIQGKRVSDGQWENISARILVDETLLWDDPCQGSEADPCRIFYSRDYANPLIAFPDEKYSEYQLRIENGSFDETELQGFKTAPILPKTTIGKEGLFSGEVGALKQIRIVESATEYVRFMTQRTTSGQLRLVSRFYRNNAFVGETIIATH